ncbi:MAG: pilus assembly protein PilP [Mariprofundales bacterium]|nr:pilus assembly protein PilP [Mariprofundales bacterium]
MKMIVGLFMILLVATPAWANNHPESMAAAIDVVQPYSADQKDAHQMAMKYVAALNAGQSDAASAMMVMPQTERLQDKMRLMLVRQMELIRGGDVVQSLLNPVRVDGDWALVLLLEKHPKMDRNRVKLNALLLQRQDDAWKVVPAVVYSDPAINVSRNLAAQRVQRWYRRHQQALRSKYVAPLLQGDALPDAMRHLARAPVFNIERLRDPFASYLAKVAKHSEKLLLQRKTSLASRPHEVLEDFDLLSLHLVAIYTMDHKRVAMLEDSEGKGYVVTVGNYMGKYNGKIIAIDADAIHLVEEVVNPAGRLVHKPVVIQLAAADSGATTK